MSLNKKQKEAVWSAFKTLRFTNQQISECLTCGYQMSGTWRWHNGRCSMPLT